ncbi:hypothetical protein JCM11491_004726 [Sporobolomyces phaffii]
MKLNAPSARGGPLSTSTAAGRPSHAPSSTSTHLDSDAQSTMTSASATGPFPANPPRVVRTTWQHEREPARVVDVDDDASQQGDADEGVAGSSSSGGRDERTGAGDQDDHDRDQDDDDDDYDDDERQFAHLRFLPSTTTSVVTTTTTLTTHFAPLKIPKSSTARRRSRRAFAGVSELVDREAAEGGAAPRGGLGQQLDAKTFPLSETEWTATGLGTFKLELGELTARFEHEASSPPRRRRSSKLGAGAGDAKGKGKEPQMDRGDWDEPTRPTNDRFGGAAREAAHEPRASSSSMTATTVTRTSPGPPPRKRPRSEAHVGDDGHVSLPSPPTQSPPSPVQTPTRGDDEMRGPGSAARRAIPAPPSFDLGSTPAVSALLALPDLVDTFDELSPALQSYVIFTLLRRSSIPVLQTVANLIAPALRRDFLSDLPPELSVQILGYLDPTTLCRASLVCKSWRRLVDGEWRIWKDMMDRDGLWIGDGSEERDAREIVTGKKENSFLERWKAGVWDEKKPSTWNGKVDADSMYGDNVAHPPPRRPSMSASSVRPASPTDSREPSPVPVPVSRGEIHSVHPYKILYRRRWLTRRNWKQAEPKRTTFTSSTATTNVVTCLQFDEEKIVSAFDDDEHLIHVFDTQSGSERAELRGHVGGVWALQYVGHVLVSGATDKSVRVWDLDALKCTHEFLGHTSTVRCLQIVEPINVNPDADGDPVWEPPYPLVVTGSRDWSLRVWKLPYAGRDREYHPAVPMSPTEGGAEPTDNPYYERQLSGHRHAIRAVAAVGRTVVSGSYDHNVRVWDLLTGECRHVLEGHSQKVYSVVLDHHRGRCASGSMDGTVKVWSTETGEQLHSLDGHSSLVGLLGLSRRCLVSAAADWTLRIWNPETGECRHALNAHQGAITCFQHDEYKVVSGSDGTLKMWDTQTGEFVRDLLANLTGVWQVAFNQRYCIAAVQRQGMSEFELLDFGSVSEDEIKPDDRRAGTTTTTATTAAATSPPTPPNHSLPPGRPRIDDHDTDMHDPSSSSRPSHEATPASRASASRHPSALGGPSEFSRFRAAGAAGATTPDNHVDPASSSSSRPGAAAGGALRRIDSTRNLVDHTAFSTEPRPNDSPTVQGGGASSSMDVDGDDDAGTAEVRERRTHTRSESPASRSARD